MLGIQKWTGAREISTGSIGAANPIIVTAPSEARARHGRPERRPRQAARYSAPLRIWASAIHTSSSTRLASGTPAVKYNRVTPAVWPAAPSASTVPAMRRSAVNAQR